MAKTILREPYISVNGVPFHDHASSVEITLESDDVDMTSFTALYKEHGVGMSDASVQIKLFQDFAAGSVHATLLPIYTGKVAVPIVIRPTQAAASSTNPQMTMQGLLMNYSPLSGAVGEASQTQITFQNGSSTGPTWSP